MTAIDIAATLTDREVVAATLWGEARGDPVLGRIAVACVIRNRMARRKQTARQVCLAHAQFSTWTPAGGEANYQAFYALVTHTASATDAIWLECLWIAGGILTGACRDVTRGADHYVATSILSSPQRPAWIAAMACVGTVAAHTFYRS
jgi:N-acetylmuramoyl-L-alanine amidase